MQFGPIESKGGKRAEKDGEGNTGRRGALDFFFFFFLSVNVLETVACPSGPLKAFSSGANTIRNIYNIYKVVIISCQQYFAFI